MKALIKLQLLLDISSLILFGYFAWTDKGAGYLTACLWVVIAMMSHFKEHESV